MKALLVVLSLLLATVASAQSIQPGYLSGSGQPGYAVELTSANTAGIYLLGPSSAMTYAEIKLGSALRGTLYNCFAVDADAESSGAGDGTVDASAKCTAVLGLGGDGNASLLGGGRYLHVDIDTPESAGNRSLLVVRGSNTLSKMSEEEMCAAGLQGFGYSAAQRRWKKTCVDFNWDGWRDSSQMNASWVTTCTAEGQPEATCLYNGDKVYHGFGLHRLALALQYTADGGKAIALDHPYTDDGAGLIQGTATRAKFPRPFDPEWEARPEFVYLGYPTTLNAILYNRGVTLEGSGAPRVIRSHPARPEITDQTPLYLGSWLIDNRGLSGVLGAFDGEANNIENPNYYRNQIGWNPYNVFCNTTSNTNPACNVNVEDERLKMPGSNEYGYQSPILADYKDATIGYVCVSDTVSGSSQANATGMCRGNRLVLCWNGGAASGRNVGGCVFDTDSDGDFTTGDTGNLNLGVCESFHDSLQYDRATAAQDLQLALNLPHCPDDSASSADCTTNITAPGAPSGTPFVGWNQTIVDIASTGAPGTANAWTGIFGQMGSACGAGGAWVETASVAGIGGASAQAAENRRTYYLGSPYMTVRAVRRDKVDVQHAGPRNFGFAPASWYGRNSSNNAEGDCLSGNDVDTGDDEAACDTETQLGHASAYNGWSEGNLFFRSSYATGKSTISETYPGGGPNYFVNNTVVDHLRGTGFDWGEGVIRGLSLNGFGATPINPAFDRFPVIQCYSDDCVVEDSLFRRVMTSNFYQYVVFTTNNIARRNQYEQISIGGDAFYLIRDAGHSVIEDERYSGINGNGGPMVKMTVGYGSIQKPSLTFRGNTGLVSAVGGQSTAPGNGAPQAIVVVESGAYNTSRTDLFRKINIDGNVLTSKDSNVCMLWLEDDCSATSAGCANNDAASLTRENAGLISVTGNSLVGTGADMICAGAYRTSGVLSNASNDRGLSAENYLPIVFGNAVNNAPYLVNLTQAYTTEAGLDADNLPDGTRVTVFDGTAGCAHTTGNLTAGTARVTCIAHPNTGADDGTWTAD